jgi:PilZ domain
MRLKASSEVQTSATASVPCRSFLPRENTRQHPRKEVSLPVTLVAGLEEVHGEIVDLSVIGAFTLLPHLPDPTRPFRLIIDLPDRQPLILSAEVVRFDIRPTDDNLSHLYGVAVRFINVSDDASLVLLDALR